MPADRREGLDGGRASTEPALTLQRSALAVLAALAVVLLTACGGSGPAVPCVRAASSVVLCGASSSDPLSARSTCNRDFTDESTSTDTASQTASEDCMRAFPGVYHIQPLPALGNPYQTVPIG
jgi:hypothetical protein